MVPDNMDALEWLRKDLEAEGSDLLREMARTFAGRLMARPVSTAVNSTRNDGPELIAEATGDQLVG
ncbi:MAG: hypothetical protein ACRDZS_06300 [Acidimicrobiales bacterium]